MRWLALPASGLLAACIAQGATEAAATSSRLNHRELLLFRDEQNEVKAVRRPSDWLRRRAEVLQGMEEVMGPLPGPAKRCPLEVRIEEETDRGAYVRRFLTYAAEPGDRVPAYLLVPKAVLNGSATAAGVLCLHQTHPLGQKVVVGLGHSPADEYGVELVEQGYVCLAPAYPQLANYQPNLKALGYQSGVMKAVWNNLRGLDLLAALPGVRGAKFGAIGHSLGGHTAVFTAVFDSRLEVVVSSCGLDSFEDYMGGDLTGWTSERYMPRLKAHGLRDLPFDFPELIGALAPRFCLISAPLGDTNFQWRSVYAIGRAASPVYALYRVPHHLRIEHPNCGHHFPAEMRTLAYRWFADYLK